MILITGGRASGKRTYAHRLGYADAEFGSTIDGGCSVLVEAQEFVRKEDVDLDVLVDRIAEDKQVVICTEVGAGVVPADAADRAFRDRAGALAQMLAKRADTVVRMVCGIPQVLKRP